MSVIVYRSEMESKTSFRGVDTSNMIIGKGNNHIKINMSDFA
jgi:hypothetical protein